MSCILPIAKASGGAKRLLLKFVLATGGRTAARTTCGNFLRQRAPQIENRAPKADADDAKKNEDQRDHQNIFNDRLAPLVSKGILIEGLPHIPYSKV